MLAIFIVALLAAGYGASEEELDRSCEELHCGIAPLFTQFVEYNNEELQEICQPAIEFGECYLRYGECLNASPEDLQKIQNITAVMREVCSEDTFLHAAVVDNLECFIKFVNNGTRFCDLRESSFDRDRLFADALSEEGLVSFTDNADDTSRLLHCINMMKSYACESLLLERQCSTVAKDAFVEVVQRVAPLLSEECDVEFDLLPAVLRLYKLELEKENRIIETLRKRK